MQELSSVAVHQALNIPPTTNCDINILLILTQKMLSIIYVANPHYLRCVASMLVLDMRTSTFLFLKKVLTSL